MDDRTTTELKNALAALGTKGADVGGALDAIERIGREQAAALPARLKHYLSRRSYGKALAFLEGRKGENEKGNCA